MKKLQKQTFLQGAIVLVVANLLTKIIGAIFKVPLGMILDENSMGIYNSAYQCYTFCFIIATVGLPTAVSKLISEEAVLGRTKNVTRVFRMEMLLIVSLGAIGAIALLIFAEPIAAFMQAADGTVLTIRIIAPALLFVAIMAGLRGYFQGMQNMYPTGISEIIEAAGKPLFGLILAVYFVKTSMTKAAAGAIFGVTAGTVIGAAVILWMYFSHKRTLTISELPKGDIAPYSKIFKKIVLIAIPITIGGCVSTLTTLADTLFIRRILMNISFSTQQAQALFDQFSIHAKEGVFDSLLTGANLGKDAANWLYGAYSGYAMTIYNLPLALIAAIATCVVPALSGAFAANNKKEINMIMSSSVRITVLFSLPCTVGLSVLGIPILNMLYGRTASGQMLQTLAFAIVFVTLVSVTSSILQAVGKVWLPVIHMVIGAVVKIVTSYLFIGIPSVNILGASFSTIACYFVIAGLNIFWVIKVTKFKFDIKEFVIKPIIASAVMGVVTLATYKMLGNFLSDSRLDAVIITFVSMAVAAVVYGVMVVLLKIIKKEDVMLLPKGEKIAGFLEAKGILK